MHKREICNTAINVPNTTRYKYKVTLTEYTHEHDNSVEYVVQVYDYIEGILKECSYDNIVSARHRFLFEMENAVFFECE